MKKFIQKIGATEVVIALMILLAILILGLMSYIIIDQTSGKNDNPQNASQAQSNLKEDSIDPKFPIKVSFKYPNDWNLTRETIGILPIENDDGVSEYITIASASGKTTVSLSAQNIDMRVGCNPGDFGKVLSVQTAPLQNSKDVSFVESIESDKDKSNVYYLYSGLAETKTVANIKPSDSSCKAILARVLTRHHNPEIYVSARITIKDINEEFMDKNPGLATIKNVTTSPEYKQAVEIIKSIKIED